MSCFKTAFTGALLLLCIPLPMEAIFEQQPPAANHRQFDNAIAAVVEDRIITYQDVYEEAARLAPQVRQTSTTEAQFMQRMQELEQEIIRSKVDRILMIKAFEDRGLQLPESIVANEVNEILMRDFNGDRSRLVSHLRSRGMSMRQFRQDIREDIKVQYMRSQMRRSEAVVSPVRIEEYYQRNPESFRRAESVHLRLIRLAGENEEVLGARIDEVYNALENGMNFEEAAREYSLDQRRDRGGSWGWLDVSDLRETWQPVVSSLEKGRYSDALKSGEREAFILYVEDRREAGVAPLGEVRDEIEEILASRMAREAQERWLERLRRDAYVRYYSQ